MTDDIRIQNAETKLKKLKSLLEDRLTKTDSAMKEVIELRKKIKRLKARSK